MIPSFGALFVEVTVVGIVCFVFLALFIIAGIRQMIQNKDD